MVHATPPEIRFWRKVQRGSKNECWTWLGEKTHHGYGRFTPHPARATPTMKKGAVKIAHRMAWEYSYGIIPKGLECCHQCDNRLCCNPGHLFIGTHKQNMADMSKKGRAFRPKGELHGESKLTERQVVEIRLMYRPGVVTFQRLAKVFGVSKRLIGKIIHREAWLHVP